MTECKRTDDTQSKEPTALDEPEAVPHLSDLDVGDKVRLGERQRPQTVVRVGCRTIVDERIDDELDTPVVMVEGDWANAQPVVLAHKIGRLAGTAEGYEPKLEETSAIVDTDLGRERNVRRTHRAAPEERNGRVEAA